MSFGVNFNKRRNIEDLDTEIKNDIQGGGLTIVPGKDMETLKDELAGLYQQLNENF